MDSLKCPKKYHLFSQMFYAKEITWIWTSTYWTLHDCKDPYLLIMDCSQCIAGYVCFTYFICDMFESTRYTGQYKSLAFCAPKLTANWHACSCNPHLKPTQKHKKLSAQFWTHKVLIRQTFLCHKWSDTWRSYLHHLSVHHTFMCWPA